MMKPYAVAVSPRSQGVKLTSVVILASTLQACAGVPVPDGNGGITYVIIGVGVVSIPAPEGPPDVAVARTRTLGLMLSDQPDAKVVLGYSSSLTTLVAKDSPGVMVTTDGIGAPIITKPRRRMEIE